MGPPAGWKPHESIEESRNILKMFAKWGNHWAVTKREEDKMVGSIGLVEGERRKNPHVRMLGYALAEPC